MHGAADPRGDRVTSAGGLEPVAQRRRIEQHAETCDRQCLRVGARLQQRLEAHLRALDGFEVTGGGHVEVGESGRDHVVRAEAPLVEAEHTQVRGRRLSLAHGHRQGVTTIGDHLGGIELYAPGAEQCGQVR